MKRKKHAISHLTRRILSAMPALLLSFVMAAPSLAADPGKENLKITIHNNEGLPDMEKDQFNVYQLFKGIPDKEGEADNPEWDAAGWNNWTLADIEWGSSILETDAQTALLTALKDEGFLAKNSWAGKTNPFASVGTAADLAKVLAAHNNNKFMQGFAGFLMTGNDGGSYLTPLEVTSVLDGKGSGQTLTYDVSSSGTGYYIFQDKTLAVESDGAVSEYIIAVMGSQDIRLKASVPTVDKDIVAGGKDKKGGVSGVSGYVQFKLTGRLPKNFADYGSYEYIFHDTLSRGLTFIDSKNAAYKEHPLVVTVYPNAADAKSGSNGKTVVIKPTDSASYKGYEVKTEGTSDGCTLEVSFEDLMKLAAAALPQGEEAINVTADSVVVVTYYAQVGDQAVTGSQGNPNDVFLEYSNNPNSDSTGKTEKKTVYVYAFGLDLNKAGNDKAHEEGLDGAGFVLKDKDGNYAIFKDQWILTKDGAQTFYDTREEAQQANESSHEGITGPIRRLTGWTGKAASPESPEEGSTEAVTKLIEAYKAAKKAFEDASNENQAEGGSANTALKGAKEKLANYLLESREAGGKHGVIPDVYGLSAGTDETKPDGYITYTLQEIITPDGYNTMDDFDLSIHAGINEETGELKYVEYKSSSGGNHSIRYSKELPAVFKAGLLPDTIVNTKASFLPFTGGTGTLIFYVLGGALIAGAASYFVISYRKRK